MFVGSGIARLATALAAVTAVLTLSGPASAAPLPVPYGSAYPFLDVAVHDWNAAVPGANDWTCHPSAEHPEPVVLVTSTFLSDGVNWTSLGPYLHNRGYCVYTFNYGRTPYVAPGLNGLGPIPDSAQQTADFVNKVLAATGASKVDMVGHSQGGMVARYFINNLGGASVVDRMVLLSSPYSMGSLAGVNLTHLVESLVPPVVFDAIENSGVVPTGLVQLIDPAFWRELDGTGNGLAPNVTYTEVTSRTDEVGLFGGMSVPVGATNASTEYLQNYCPTDLSTHFEQPYSPTAVALIGNALDPARAIIPPCAIVPITGP
jgi:pimeloyl-ACP methyl ester carboxylesterase